MTAIGLGLITLAWVMGELVQIPQTSKAFDLFVTLPAALGAALSLGGMFIFIWRVMP